MAPLRHANVVMLLAACWEDGPDKLCLVIEFCHNGTLEDQVAEFGVEGSSRTWADPFRRNLEEVASALQYLHFDMAGDPLIHRDIKPANVLITDVMVAKLGDFGEATRFQTDLVELRDNVQNSKDRKKCQGVLTMTYVGSKCSLP